MTLCAWTSPWENAAMVATADQARGPQLYADGHRLGGAVALR
jgi:hypothetical protein